MPTREQEVEARGHPIFLTYKCCCLIYVLVIFLTFGTLIIFNPSFYIQTFYVPSLNKFINSTTTGAGNADGLIFFYLEIQNGMDTIGVRYDAVNLTFSYRGTNATSCTAIGSYTVAGFYQGMGKKAHRRDIVIVTGSVPWKEAAIKALLGGATAEFRVDLVTEVKFKNHLWYFKEKTIVAGGRVEVDDSGKKVGSKPVELESGEPAPSAMAILLWVAGYLGLLLVGTVVIAVGVLYFCSLFYQ